MLLQTAVLLSALVLAAGYSCPNRLYRGQRLNVSQFLCSRNQNYRLLFNNTGKVQVNEAFLSNTSFKPIPLTLFSTNTTSPSPSHVTFTDAGDLVAVGTDGAVYWQANVSGADFLELQDTGIAVLFAKNVSTVQVLWKSLSTYSLRIVGGTNQTVGRLEFYFNNMWGSVSTYASYPLYADVACRTLGFDTGVVTTNTFGQSTGPMWMDAMYCSGRETVFQECPFGAWDSTRNWWGQVYSTSHTYDVAISCQGSSSLGVLPPTAHVCTDRLYVGQTLALGESLCAGPNGEYTLRFSNKRKDTVIELWYKTERKWSIGMTNTMPAGAAVRLDGDGVMRIVGNASGLPYNLFSNTTANASFVEQQDNGVVRVVSANGSTGWRKAPDDICYTEKRKIKSYDSGKFISSSNLRSLACLASCDSQPTCKTITYDEFSPYCYLLSGYPWDPSTTNSTYFEKIPGCSSGAGCYQSYSYDMWGSELSITSSTSTASASACTSLCDSTATCVSAYYTPTLTTKCILNGKRLNETLDNTLYTSYYRKIPCTPVDPSQVPLLPVKACPTQLLPGAFLLSQQYLCSPNGQHVLTVEKDGRLLIDGGKWISNSATNRSGYLQYTTTNQLLLRLDDGSTPWKVEGPRSDISPLSGLALSDGGILQFFDSTGNVIWDHQNGYHVFITGVLSSPGKMQLGDNNTATCVSRVRVAKLGLSNGRSDSRWNVAITGHDLQCGDGSHEGAYYVSVSNNKVMVATPPQQNEMYRMNVCKLLTAAPLVCRFQCLCQSSLCEMLAVVYDGCSDPQGDICEVAIE